MHTPELEIYDMDTVTLTAHPFDFTLPYNADVSFCHADRSSSNYPQTVKAYFTDNGHDMTIALQAWRDVEATTSSSPLWTHSIAPSLQALAYALSDADDFDPAHQVGYSNRTYTCGFVPVVDADNPSRSVLEHFAACGVSDNGIVVHIGVHSDIDCSVAQMVATASFFADDISIHPTFGWGGTQHGELIPLELDFL